MSVAMVGGWASGGASRLWIVIGVTLVFAAGARLVRGVSTTGAGAGAVVAFLLFATIGPGAFLALVSVFVLAWATTRLGYTRKERRGTAEDRRGRTASQVLANLGVSAVCAVLYVVNGNSRFVVAACAALAEAAADTVSSEYGQAARENALLITTWEQVPAGTDGGITIAGTVAGVVAALIIGGVCVATRLIPWHWFWISAGAGVLGMFADSFLGAGLERRRLLINDAVNFLSTAIAASAATGLWRVVGR